jgi:hypothetical protein
VSPPNAKRENFSLSSVGRAFLLPKRILEGNGVKKNVKQDQLATVVKQNQLAPVPDERKKKKVMRNKLGPAPLTAPVPGVGYTEKECAEFLRLKNSRTLATWRWNGRAPELKFRKIGTRIIYLGSDIIAFLNRDPKRAGR